MFIFKFFTQPHTKDTSVFVLNTQDPNNFFYFLSIKTESVKIQIKCLALCWDCSQGCNDKFRKISEIYILEIVLESQKFKNKIFVIFSNLSISDLNINLEKINFEKKLHKF